jgi:hypothetical protein
MSPNPLVLLGNGSFSSAEATVILVDSNGNSLHPLIDPSNNAPLPDVSLARGGTWEKDRGLFEFSLRVSLDRNNKPHFLRSIESHPKKLFDCYF